MRTILFVRNVSAIVFLIAVSTSSGARAAEVCGPLMLTWELNGCPSVEACMSQTVTMASGSGAAGTKCQATCSVGCNSAWIYGDLYRSNNCQIGESEWYDSGAVGCYCEDQTI